MVTDLLEQLRQLDDKIAYEQAVLAYAHYEHGPTQDGNPVSSRTLTLREKYADMLLLSLRIHLYLELIRLGRTSYRNDLLQDWDTILDALAYIENALEIDDLLANHALELILLPDPAKRGLLLRQFSFVTRHRIGARRSLPMDVYETAVHMIRYCMETRRPEEAFTISENLIALSRERNRTHPDLHRDVVVQALTWIVDANYPLTARLCAGEEHWFHIITDYTASRFYWLYAFSMNASGNSREALPLFLRCHYLCMQTEGETSWIGARAMQCSIVLRGRLDDAPDDEAFLWEFLRRIDDGFYPQADDSVDVVAAFTRSYLLQHHLEQQNLKGLLPEILRLLDYCRETEDAPPNHMLTVRYAENILSGYYLESGDLLLAVDHANNALRSIPPQPIKCVPSDILIYTNLLVVYCQMNDADQIDYLVDLLEDRVEEYEDDDYVMSRVTMIVNYAVRKLWELDEDEDSQRQELQDIHRQILTGELRPKDSAVKNVTFAQLIITQIANILDNFVSSDEELHQFRDILRYFMNHPEIYPFSNIQKMAYYAADAQILWQLNSPGVLKSLDRCLAYLDSMSAINESRIFILRFAAVVYHHFGFADRLKIVLDDAVFSITAAWQKATAYLNDHKICQILSFTQFNYNILYAVMRSGAEPEALYEQILRFKDLPALVGRERNRLLKQSAVDEPLQREIFQLQDRLAALEMNDALLGTETVQEMRERLEKLEAAFFAKFPSRSEFTGISYRDMCRNLPIGAAVVEYYFVLGSSALGKQLFESQDWELDIFVTANPDGTPQLHHLKIPRGGEIMEQATAFIDILQNPDDIARSGEKVTACAQLYRRLIAPALPFLAGITHLYIAPDGILCNLPFEILCADGSGLLQDSYRICRLVCGRDLLFSSDSTGGDSCFILGDPDYEAELGEQFDSLNREMAQDLAPVAALPFSGIEARRVGTLCRCRPYTGKAATKYALQEALPCSIIHLATHGVFDEQMVSDSLYSSHLVFAGYNKWVTNKTESSRCGNGVLTADEISRMDLTKTDLVVLSACQSGMGDISYLSTRGLISAFSAAGAKWIVSHMWKANDFTTPILMDAFYKAYLYRGYDVPNALNYAKQYLKTVTVGQLRQDGWLDPEQDSRLGPEARALLERIRSANDRRRFFSDEFYWGGFVCHKCN